MGPCTGGHRRGTLRNATSCRCKRQEREDKKKSKKDGQSTEK